MTIAHANQNEVMTEDTTLLESLFALAPVVFEAAFAVIALASAISALTPTPRDDEFWGRLYTIVEVLALNIGRAKQVPPNRAGGRFTPN